MNTYSVTFYVWSSIGHTPITSRKGSYCDELVNAEHHGLTVNQAVEKLVALVNGMQDANDGVVIVHGYNHNRNRIPFHKNGRVPQI